MLAQLMKLTGFDYEYLLKYVPVPLSPEGWERLSRSEQEEKIVKQQLHFSQESVENFFGQLAKEAYFLHGFAQRIESLERTMGRLEYAVLEVRSYMRDYQDVITLKEIAGRLDMHPGTLRRMITNRRNENGVESATLEVRGLTLELFKRERGDWCCRALDFTNQRRHLSFKNLRGVK